MSTPDEPLLSSEMDENERNVAPFVRRSPRISQGDVFRAADELLVEGNRPTIDRVRMRLGRGSPNTINDHLDAWWARLGSRLRDLPGNEFPQVPERVGQALQHLWNEALEGAHEALRDTLAERERTLAERDQALEARSQELAQREQALAARAAALEESLVLAREQLTVANHRAQTLETAVRERASECTELRARISSLESACADLQGKLDAAAAAYQGERTQLQEQHAATERHWLTELDRARQSLRDAERTHDQAIRQIRQQADGLQGERDRLREELVQARGELSSAAAVRERLAAKLRAFEESSARARKFRPRSPAGWPRRP